MYKTTLKLSQRIKTGNWNPSSIGDTLITADYGRLYRCVVTHEDVITYSAEERSEWSGMDWDEVPHDEGDGELYVKVEEITDEEYRKIMNSLSSITPERDGGSRIYGHTVVQHSVIRKRNRTLNRRKKERTNSGVS